MRIRVFIFSTILISESHSKLFASRLNDAIVQKTLTWNKLNTEQNLQDLEKIYPKTVIGYGVRSTTAKFIDAKAKFYKWAKGFTQTIVSDFTIKKYKDGQKVCEFCKYPIFRTGLDSTFQFYDPSPFIRQLKLEFQG